MTTRRKGRTLNANRDQDVCIGLNAAQAKAINALIATGLWGNTAAECVRRLMDYGLIHNRP